MKGSSEEEDKNALVKLKAWWRMEKVYPHVLPYAERS